MPGYLIDVTSTITCAHLGQAQPGALNPRVKACGQATVVQSTPYAVAGCALTGSPNPPCATAQWTSAATRLQSGGQPLLLQDSLSTCAPTGTPLTASVTQIRVKGT